MSDTVTIPAKMWKDALVKIDTLAAENERLVNLVAYLKEGKPLTKHEDDIRRGLRTK